MRSAIGIVQNINQETHEVTVKVTDHPFPRFIGSLHTAPSNEFALIDLVETEYDCTMTMAFCPFPNRLDLGDAPKEVKKTRLEKLLGFLVGV